MINDIDILSVLKNREDYDRYYPFVKANLLTKEGDIISKYLASFYDAHKGVTDITWSAFATYFFMKHPTMDATNKKLYTHLFTTLDGYVPDVTKDIIMKELVRKTYATKIADKCLHIADGKDDDPLDSIEVVLEEAKQEAANYEEDDPSDHGFSYEALFDDSEGTPLQFSLKGLQEAVDAIHKGDFVVVGAHPDTGKTTFLIDQMVHMAAQLPEGKKAIYFNNEQRLKVLQHRVVSRAIGMTTADIKLDPKNAFDKYEATGLANKILIYDNALTDRFVLDKLKKQGDSVGLILFDQLWKVQMLQNKSSNEFMALGKQYAWGREVAKMYAPTITVHQLDGASTNTKYIDMQSMFGSKVALQGEADLIINIGRLTDGSEGVCTRHFYVPKNKIPSGNPTAVNNKFDAIINHDHCKFEDS